MSEFIKKINLSYVLLQLSGAKWQYAARAAVMTMMSSVGGGCSCIIYTLIKQKGRISVIDIINGVLGALVSITAGCFLYEGKCINTKLQ